MKIYKLKADPKLPHHYIIAIAVTSMHNENPGQMFLKYKPFYFHHSQIEKFRDVALRIQDKLFKTTHTEALRIYGLETLAHEFSMFKVSATANNCTLHHFSSEVKLSRTEAEKIFDQFVKRANTDQKTKEDIFNAKFY